MNAVVEALTTERISYELRTIPWIMKPGDKASVHGLGKAMIGGLTEYFPGDIVEAELVKQIGQGFWFVKFEGDMDEKGKQIIRVRAVI